ncbi:hypothetical protein TTHERM_000107179 (macronuclear) [Tetrahymena thermophila SB210]|uniref:WD domain, G-beta repeat protein n=1 Tax=Tetrahymena thermophila (strain SB210) TaxID=312017 RepID=W7X7T1_TETTS|nr:hypothetical protein TTHERM_000107179 [Tetrahymena thermophila SB210]EWS75430.1 hypothetical protein TTHERM_000107179 [Tetrahymena thermophila SB210]|eukprot:XP_012652104.1 hypothetical protein TTHERM_000107179 [Tetrahymena thermophila SB210]
MIKKIMPNNQNKKKYNGLDFENFQCKLFKKIDLNEKVQEEKQVQCPIIGSAWSGINQRLDSIPLFYYGTQNGIIVRLSMEKLAQNIEIESNQQSKEGQQSQNQTKKDGLQVIKQLRHVISRQQQIKDNNLFSQQDNQICEQDHILHIKAFQIYGDKQPCYQVGQVNNCVILSGREQYNFELKIFDENLNLLQTLQNQVSTQHFTRSFNNILIFRNTMSFEQSSQILFSKIIDQKLKLYKKQITFEDKTIFPTTILADGDFLFVGLYQKKVYVYSIKKRKLIKLINPKIDTYAKKIAYNNSLKIVVVISLEDQISFINLMSGEVIIQYKLKEIFQMQNIQFSDKFEIFLFCFVNDDVVLIGGSFNCLFFFDWKAGKVLKKYVDYANFVGAIFYNNFIYLTHEKSSFISIIQ